MAPQRGKKGRQPEVEAEGFHLRLSSLLTTLARHISGAERKRERKGIAGGALGAEQKVGSGRREETGRGNGKGSPYSST